MTSHDLFAIIFIKKFRLLCPVRFDVLFTLF